MARVIDTLLAELPAQGLCLEIGVGTGRIALPLIRAGRSIVGVDISMEMMRKLVENSGGTPPPLVAGDAAHLPFRDRSFTSAIASHVMHLVPEWRTAVDELFRVMGPGGVLVVTRGRRRRGDWATRVSRHFFAEAGNPSWPPGVDRLEELDSHMQERGVLVRELPELSAESTGSVTEMLANLEAGYWSACWSLDEPTRVRAAAATLEWAAREIGDVDEVRPTVEPSVWRAYSVPRS